MVISKYHNHIRSIGFGVVAFAFCVLVSGCVQDTQNSTVSDSIADVPADVPEMVIEESVLVSPLDRPRERINKKDFGMYITPETSPIQPERFRGYHTGVDFEIFSNELEAGVSVVAVCSGSIREVRMVSGYGGVVIQECMIESKPVTILYGHLDTASVYYQPGDMIDAGSVLGLLGDEQSPETDGERKHLHLGIHKGSDIEYRGYVQSESELNEWLDPEDYMY